MTYDYVYFTVKSPGTLVVSTYAPCPDITVKIEPALLEEGSALIYVPVNPGKYRFVNTKHIKPI